MDEVEKEMWKQHKKGVSNMRNRRRSTFYPIVSEFRSLGFTVKELTRFQFRFNDCLDVYPSNKKYHDLKTNMRGDIRGKTFGEFIRDYFGIK